MPKPWGYEIWITNNELYCGKILIIKEGYHLSWHYHNIKDEVLYIDSGRIEFVWEQDGSIHREILRDADSIRVKPGTKHQIVALLDTRIIEFSTTHYEEDSIRITRNKI